MLLAYKEEESKTLRSGSKLDSGSVKIRRLTENSAVARALRWLARTVSRYRGWFVYPQLLLFVFCVAYTARNLRLNTSRANLVGSNNNYNQSLEELKKEFPNRDDLVVVVESAAIDKNRRFVEFLGARLETETNLFRDVLYRGDLKMLGSKALFFLGESELVGLKKSLVEARPFMQQFTRATNLVSLFDTVNAGFRTARRERNDESESMLKAFPALERIVNEAVATLEHPGRPLSPGVSALFSKGDTQAQDVATEAESQGYLAFASGRIYLVSVRPVAAQFKAQAIERLQTLIEQTKLQVPGLNVGLTGETVLEHAEMRQSKKDTELASVVALLASALIFIYGYHETARPVKATFCLIIGVGYTLAFATATVGQLNILTITFVPILIGLAIDYGVHLISRYEEELSRGRTEQDAMLKAMVYTGQGILIGAFTTAGAFWAMTLTHFRGIQEMGIICGGGLLVCLIPMMTMLPVLLLQERKEAGRIGSGVPALQRARLENLWLKKPLLVTCSTLGICALAAWQIPKVYFDYNLLHMQSAGLPAVQYEKKLLDMANRSVLFGAVLSTNQQHARLLSARLTNLPAVRGVESMTKYFSEDPDHQLELIRGIKEVLPPVVFQLPDPEPVNLFDLSRTLYSLYGYLGAASSVLQNENPLLAGQFLSLRQSVHNLRRAMLRGTAAELNMHSLKLAGFQRALFDEVRQTFQLLKNQDCSSPLRAQDLPQVLRDRFIGASGKWLLMVYPKKDLRVRENQREFIEQVQTVCGNLTGSPVQLYYYTDLLKRSYEEAARYALVAIVLLVFFHFRSLLCIALALLPVAIGFLWLGGIMGFFNVQLNPANIMMLPLVIGIGVTNGIHILNRYAEEQTPGILARSTGKAVFVSGLTSIAGFGSLILAKHKGIQSLGYVMSCGLAACMLGGLVFLPAVLTLLITWNSRRKLHSHPHQGGRLRALLKGHRKEALVSH